MATKTSDSDDFEEALHVALDASVKGFTGGVTGLRESFTDLPAVAEPARFTINVTGDVHIHQGGV